MNLTVTSADQGRGWAVICSVSWLFWGNTPTRSTVSYTECGAGNRCRRQLSGTASSPAQLSISHTGTDTRVLALADETQCEVLLNHPAASLTFAETSRVNCSMRICPGHCEDRCTGVRYIHDT